MKAILIVAALMILCIPAHAARGQELSEISQPPNGGNQKAEVSQWIGLIKISIAYHSPHVHNPPGNDRTGHIWGELVQYGFYDDGFGPSKGVAMESGRQ